MSKDDRELIEQEYRKTATIRAVQWFKMGDHPAVKPIGEAIGGTNPGQGWVDTLEGGHIVTPGDWIATGIQGEHWPIKPDIFAATYELAVTRLEALQAQPVGETFVARIGNRPMAQIDGVDELLRLINGGAKFAEIYRGQRIDNVDSHVAALTASPPVVEREAIDVVDRARQIAQESYDAIRPTGVKFWGELDDMTQTLAIVAARDAILALTPVEGVGERRMLLDLLATIHRDGGQHVDSVGVEQATADAIRLSAERIVQSDGSAAYRNCATINRQMAGTIGAQPGSSIFAALEACAERMDEIALSAPVAQGDEVREALELAYGLLWHMSIDIRDPSLELASEARKVLLSVMDKDAQYRGILQVRTDGATLTKGARDAG